MTQSRYPARRKKRKARPLDETVMEELALAYVARFATSAGKLEDYLKRKLRERGFVGHEEGEEPPDIAALVERFVDRKYVDDAGYARAKTSGLLARGYGARRVSQALMQAGIGEDIRDRLEPGEAERREAAFVMARKRRFGPFDANAPTGELEAHKRREKHLAAMVRAGHDFSTAKWVIDASCEDDLHDWIAEAREEEETE